MGEVCSTFGGRIVVYRVLVGKLEGKRQLGRRRRRWKDDDDDYDDDDDDDNNNNNNNMVDLQEVGCGGMDWIDLAQIGTGGEHL